MHLKKKRTNHPKKSERFDYKEEIDTIYLDDQDINYWRDWVRKYGEGTLYSEYLLLSFPELNLIRRELASLGGE